MAFCLIGRKIQTLTMAPKVLNNLPPVPPPSNSGLTFPLSHWSYFYLFIFKVYFIDYVITVFPIFPFCPSSACTPNPPAFPPLVHVHGLYICSLSSLFPIPFFTSPCLFYAYKLRFFFPLPFHPYSSPPSPYRKSSMWYPFLWFGSCSSCLLSICFCCFSFF